MQPDYFGRSTGRDIRGEVVTVGIRVIGNRAAGSPGAGNLAV